MAVIDSKLKQKGANYALYFHTLIRKKCNLI